MLSHLITAINSEGNITELFIEDKTEAERGYYGRSVWSPNPCSCHYSGYLPISTLRAMI